MGNLKKVNLHYANLTTQHIIAVLKVCISSSSLIDVSLSTVYTRFIEVPAELLAEAVGHLRIVNLAYLANNLGLTGMSTEQCLGVLKACISSFTLTDVDLAGNNLRMIPEEFLANAVGHLEKVSLHSTQMTTGQCVAVLEVCVSSSKLIDVNMELADREIPVELLARAASNLQTINLSECVLATDQCIAVLESTHFSSKLENVTLWCDNLEEVPAELLAQAAAQLKTIEFDEECNLTAEQCIALLEASISSTKLNKLTLDPCHDAIPFDLLDRARKTGRIIFRQ